MTCKALQFQTSNSTSTRRTCTVQLAIGYNPSSKDWKDERHDWRLPVLGPCKQTGWPQWVGWKWQHQAGLPSSLIDCAKLDDPWPMSVFPTKSPNSSSKVVPSTEPPSWVTLAGHQWPQKFPSTRLPSTSRHLQSIPTTERTMNDNCSPSPPS